MFPEINSAGLSVEKMLSIRVFDFVLIRVSDVLFKEVRMMNTSDPETGQY